MKRFGVIGIVSSFLLITITIVLGGPLGPLVNIPAIVIVLGLGLGLHLVTVRDRAMLTGNLLFRLLFSDVSDDELKHDDVSVVRSLIAHVYAGGAIGFLISLFQVMFLYSDETQLGPATAFCLLTVIYAAVLAECILRPCVYRIELLRGQSE